uniref:Uncharacterized protein n=1 Tax=Ixodes ricinus TaxID=34613 RepID=A0A6B0UCD9_IXORI
MRSFLLAMSETPTVWAAQLAAVGMIPSTSFFTTSGFIPLAMSRHSLASSTFARNCCCISGFGTIWRIRFLTVSRMVSTGRSMRRHHHQRTLLS